MRKKTFIYLIITIIILFIIVLFIKDNVGIYTKRPVDIDITNPMTLYSPD